MAAARVFLALPAIPPRIAAYLAQQAAEKALKASIALQGIEPPLTHDLVYLFRESPADAGLYGVVGDIVALARPHLDARYSAVDETAYDHDEVELLVVDASRLVVAVQRFFDQRGLAGTELTPA
jgi:HEPN domain-containing protein